VTQATSIRVPLYRLAHSRSGDKGNTSNLSLIAWRADLYPLLCSTVTPARVSAWFEARRPSAVRCYALPKLHALNFVLEGVLDGGVNDALNLDAHGKSLSFWLLSMEVEVPSEWVADLPDFLRSPT